MSVFHNESLKVKERRRPAKAERTRIEDIPAFGEELSPEDLRNVSGGSMIPTAYAPDVFNPRTWNWAGIL